MAPRRPELPWITPLTESERQAILATAPERKMPTSNRTTRAISPFGVVDDAFCDAADDVANEVEPMWLPKLADAPSTPPDEPLELPDEDDRYESLTEGTDAPDRLVLKKDCAFKGGRSRKALR